MSTINSQVTENAPVVPRDSYVNPIFIEKNNSDVYINEVVNMTTKQFRKNKTLYATTTAPSLYDLARKLVRGDNIILISPTHISPKYD